MIRFIYSKLFSISTNTKIFKRIAGAGNGNHMYHWKFKGLSDERINSMKTSDYGINPHLSYYNTNKK